MSGSGLPRWDAIVLAGGRSRRMGHDKLVTRVAGRPLMEHALAAVSGAERIVIVGPDRGYPEIDGGGTVLTVHEEPAFAGPLVAIAAAVPLLAAEVAVVIAGDTYGAGGDVIALVSALAAHPGVDVACGMDRSGHRQPLLSAYRRRHLEAVLGARDDAAGGLESARAWLLLDTPRLVDIPVWAEDVDTPDDLQRIDNADRTRRAEGL